MELIKSLNNKNVALIYLVLGFVLYANTIGHDYALDDAIVITQNKFTKKGFEGIPDLFKYDTFTGFFGVEKNLVAGGRYRPLSLVTFAIEYEFFDKNPHVSHFINILLYIFCTFLVYLVLKKLIPPKQKSFWLENIPFIAGILYLVHPIHTEVVANIKGRDEMMTFLGSLGALYYTVRFTEVKKYKYLLFAALVFFLGFLSKENAVTFLAVIPLSLYFFKKVKGKELLKIMTPIFLAAGVFLYIRYAVLFAGKEAPGAITELMNNPFVHASFIEKYATILFTFGVYIKLLLFPHPLTYDYYPKQIPIVSFDNIYVILSLAVFVGMLVYAIVKFNKKTIPGYAIWFFFITFSVVSNVAFPVGTFMNERFVFISSLSVVLIMAYILAKLSQNKSNLRTILIGVFLIVTVLYSGKTISRNPAWENDFVLFTTDVNVSYNSAKSTCSAGGKLIEEAQKPENKEKRKEYLEKAIDYLNQSIAIHPTYTDALLLLGNAHFEYNENLDKTFEYYLRALKRAPRHEKIYQNIFKSKISLMFQDNSRVDKNIEILKKMYKLNPNRFETCYQLGSQYGKFKGKPEKAIPYLERAVKLNPKSESAYKDIGVAYGMTGQYEKALNAMKKALQFDPEDFQTYMNIGTTYLRLNNKEEAQKYIQKGQALKQKSQK